MPLDRRKTTAFKDNCNRIFKSNPNEVWIEGSRMKAPRNPRIGTLTRTVNTYNQQYDQQQPNWYVPRNVLESRPENLCSKARAHKTDQQQIYTPKSDGWQKARHTTPHLLQPKTDCSHSQNEEAKTAGSNLAQDLWRMKQARFWGKRSHLNTCRSLKKHRRRV